MGPELSNLYSKVRNLILAGSIRISEHGYDELAENRFTVKKLLNGVYNALIIEEFFFPNEKFITLPVNRIQ